MRTLKLTLAYDGAPFVGWQRQAAGDSIQGLLEAALARFEGGPVTVHGAGRTDAGVHALGQVASAVVTCAHDPAVLLRGLNAQLPRQIRVLAVDEAPAGFHARFGARSKTYRYLFRTGDVAPPFEQAYVWHLPHPLDLERMRDAAALLQGTHDFAAFQSAGTGITRTERTLTRSEIRTAPSPAPFQLPAGCTGTLCLYEVDGDGFLRHMVRAIVGTLVEIGRGSREVSEMAPLLRGGARADAGPTAPAHGLYLVRVDYD